jgi:Polyketide cyclase / dehydrase and lipid transport
MSAYRQHAHLDAPLDVVWGLVGSPSRYPEWWPRVIEVRGERFEQGDEYAQVTKSVRGTTESNFLLERRDNLHAIRMSCQLSGTYAEWLLTPAQGGTFVELEMGMQPRRLGDRLFDGTAGRGYFRRWANQSLDGLREAALDRLPSRAAGESVGLQDPGRE